MTDNVWHVFPVNDRENHILETEWSKVVYSDGNMSDKVECNCKCDPCIEYEEYNGVSGIIVVHNSYDGREGVEWTNEIINK